MPSRFNHCNKLQVNVEVSCNDISKPFLSVWLRSMKPRRIDDFRMMEQSTGESLQ
jgi:hypothetical protein